MLKKSHLFLIGLGLLSTTVGFKLYRDYKSGKLQDFIEKWDDILNPKFVDPELEDEFKAAEGVLERQEEIDNDEGEDFLDESPRALTGDGLDTEAVDYSDAAKVTAREAIEKARKALFADSGSDSAVAWADDLIGKEAVDEILEEIEVKNVFDEEDEDVMKLRHNPNSEDAMDQYVNMRLADLHPDSPSRQSLRSLFSIEYSPINVEDDTVKQHILERRSEFFGLESRWNGVASVAELILHYAELADIDVDGTIQYWVDEFLEFSEFDKQRGGAAIKNWSEALVSHQLINKNGTFGIFGQPFTGEIPEDTSFQKQYNDFITALLG